MPRASESSKRRRARLRLHNPAVLRAWNPETSRVCAQLAGRWRGREKQTRPLPYRRAPTDHDRLISQKLELRDLLRSPQAGEKLSGWTT
jgi:hypothetical protein